MRRRLRRLALVTLGVAAASLSATTTHPGAADAAGRGSLLFLQTFDRGHSYRLLTSDLAGGDRRVVTEQRAVGRPAWSPDGRQIAFSGPVTDDSDGRYGIYVVNADGTGLRRLTSPRFADFDPAWSPDGQTLAFTRDNVGNSNPATCCVLGIVSVGSGAYSAVPGTTGASFPTWSGTSPWLAYVHATGLRAVRYDGYGNRLLARGRVETPDWSPDGRFVAFVLRQSRTDARLAVVSYRGGTPALRSGVSGLLEDPQWDDDNRTLYFTTYRGLGDDGRYQSAVYRSASNAGPVTRLFALPATFHRLAFSPGPVAGASGLGAVSVAGDALQWTVTNAVDAPATAATLTYGIPGNLPVAGDWDGDGDQTPGVVNVRDGVFEWYLTNDLSSPRTAYRTVYGVTGNLPVVGDWDGDGRDSIGVVDTKEGRLDWYLSNRVTGAVTAARFSYGIAGDLPVVGDWDGDGRSSPGVAHPGGEVLQWYLSNRQVGAAPVYRFAFGAPDTLPVAGDWNGDGVTTVGVVDRRTGQLEWLLTDTNVAPGVSRRATYGAGSDLPVVGDWDGR